MLGYLVPPLCVWWGRVFVFSARALALLLRCFCAAFTLLLRCFYTAFALLLHCFCAAFTLLLRCFYTAFALLLHLYATRAEFCTIDSL
jgi:hypothetical protein